MKRIRRGQVARLNTNQACLSALFECAKSLVWGSAFLLFSSAVHVPKTKKAKTVLSPGASEQRRQASLIRIQARRHHTSDCLIPFILFILLKKKRAQNKPTPRVSTEPALAC